MTKTQFSYTILRYVPDIVTGEHLNIGVVVYAPSVPYIQARIQREYGRLSAAFADIPGEHYRRIVKHVESRINDLGTKWVKELRFSDLPSDAVSAASLVLQQDDSALQYSPPGGGVTADLDQELDFLFNRFVLRNQPKKHRECRDEVEVWKAFKTPLEERQVLSALKPVQITGASSFEYEFEHAWKNEKWHPLQPISMDAIDPHTLQERAEKWAGRATDLRAEPRLGRLSLLIGPPSDTSLNTAYGRALSLLDGMQVDHEIIKEDEASDFARELSSRIALHGAKPNE